jgi:hypothetical protein
MVESILETIAAKQTLATQHAPTKIGATRTAELPDNLII